MSDVGLSVGWSAGHTFLDFHPISVSGPSQRVRTLQRVMTFEGLRQAGLPNSAHLSAGGGGAIRYKGSSINYIITFGGLGRPPLPM